MGSDKKSSRERLLQQIDAAIQKIDKKRGKRAAPESSNPKPDGRG